MRLWLLSGLTFRRLRQLEYHTIEVIRKVNDVGALVLTLPDLYDPFMFPRDTPLFIDSDDPLLSTSLFFVKKVTASGVLLVLECDDQIKLLKESDIWYSAGSTYAKKTAPLDNQMKAIVRENMISGSTDANRVKADLTVDADTSAAPSATRGYAWQNVLKTLQELAKDSQQQGTPLYFDFVMSSSGSGVFRTYPNTRGTDRRASGQLIGRQYGNIADDAKIILDYTNEANAVIALGSGEEGLRLTQSAKDNTRIAVGKWSRVEATVEDSNEDSTAGLLSMVRSELATRRSIATLSGTLQETQGFQYGRDWLFGDLLTVEERGLYFDCRVDVVRLTISADGRIDRSAQLAGEVAI